MPPWTRISLLFGSLLLPRLAPAQTADHELSCEKDVRPILKRHCFQCHGEGEKLKGGLDLRLRRFMVLPDEDGKPPLIPGKPEESELIKLVREGEMPKKAAPLPAGEIAILEE